jgi:hypothetical protein
MTDFKTISYYEKWDLLFIKVFVNNYILKNQSDCPYVYNIVIFFRFFKFLSKHKFNNN